MKVEQTRWTNDDGWSGTLGGLGEAQLVLAFGGGSALARTELLDELRAAYPQARLAGCTTAGEICGIEVTDDSLVATAVNLETTRLGAATVSLADFADSQAAGAALAEALAGDDLAHLFVISDGLQVNGSELVRGLVGALPEGVTVTGGLSGDGARFQETQVFLDDAPASGQVVGLAFYGDALRVGYASLGGWDPFGPERTITKAKANVLYEIDDQPALELYKRYLGEHAEGLPATGLLFPLSLRSAEQETPVVRTILAVDEEAGSITFAGDMPVGALARLMKANFDRLVDGAEGAARNTSIADGAQHPELALCISCVGRKLVLKQRVEEEVEGVREVLGEDTVLAGFYSYGEISPFTPNARCELHNQTMTITTLSEAPRG